MSMQNTKASFGQKGANDKPISLAQSLLTGKPLSRTPVQDRTPKLKPRAKPRFGRKEETHDMDRALPRENSTRKWTFWLAMVVALVTRI